MAAMRFAVIRQRPTIRQSDLAFLAGLDQQIHMLTKMRDEVARKIIKESALGAVAENGARTLHLSEEFEGGCLKRRVVVE